MNKKLFLTSIITTILSCPAYSDNITTNNKDCDHDNLSIYSGDATLEATWGANTVNITWYADGEEIELDQEDAGAATCEYDGTLTLPTPPSKDGYTFAGWTVKSASAPQCDFSGLSDTTTKGKEYAYTSFTGSAGHNEATYGLTQGSGEWAVEFYHGIVKGQALCSTVGLESGYSLYQTGEPTDDLDLNNLENGAKYCWCQMTSYTPKPWVYDTGDASSNPIYLTGYTNKSGCKKAIRAITGLNSSDADTLLNSASSNNPQLITNATGATLAYLNDNGCTTSGAATGHFEEKGSACPVAEPRWVLACVSGGGNAQSCAHTCPYECAEYLKNIVYSNDTSALRRVMFGTAQ